ncbi:hypothetical protein RRF57_000677 [Xylaria bambusicola]|uniref:Glycoside hydrolase family 5 domain-containing protein n=1 Tax=Xylaria bambusicola TaxID=326684 RepID=A0AAN7UG50_9PEZI
MLPPLTHAVALLQSTALVAVSCTNGFKPIAAPEHVTAGNPGWNLGNTLDTIPNEGSWNNAPMQAEIFVDIGAEGFKSVRIPVTAIYADHYVSSSPDWKINPKWLRRVSDVIEAAVDAGLYALTNIDGTLDYQLSSVAFELINEPPIETAEQLAELNKVNGLFLKALKVSGGFNSKRVVALVGGASDSIKTSQWLRQPLSFAVSLLFAIRLHIQRLADIASIESDLENIRGNFTDVPLLIREFDASPSNTEPAARRKYMDVVVQKATELDTAVSAWDNGQWKDPQSLGILLSAAAVTRLLDQTIYMALNGDTLESVTIEDGSELSASTDYTIIGVTGQQSESNDLFSAGATAGVKIVQWDVPVLGSTFPTAVPSADLHIPITWAGLNQVAAVRMFRNQHLGPLQASYGTWSGQWNWDASGVILTAATVDAVIAAGIPTAFTFDFFPGVLGNSVNYTLRV